MKCAAERREGHAASSMWYSNEKSRLNVKSHSVMERIDCKSERSFLPLLADELVRGEASEGLESFGEVVCHEEGLQVLFELLMGLVVEAFDGGILQSSVHALDLPIGPGMLGFGEAMLDGVLLASIGEGMDSEEERGDGIDFLFC